MLWDGLEAVLWVLFAFLCIPPQGQHTPPNMVVFTLLAPNVMHTKDRGLMPQMHITIYWSTKCREYAL